MKKEMYICDGEGGKCGAVLLHPEDGFVLQGKILTGIAGANQQTVLESQEGAELVLCRECLFEGLGATVVPAQKIGE